MKYSFRCEWVRCCNPRCKSCPHGPYWYGYYREAGKLHKKYFGREDPRAPGMEPPHPDDSIFSAREANAQVAFRILGIPEGSSAAEAKSAFRRRSREAHPDRGGNEADMKRVNTAWSWLRARFGW